MVHPKRDRHMPCVVGQQWRGLRTSRKGRPYNRAGRYQRNTPTSPPSLGLNLRLRHNIICRKIICLNIFWHLLIICHLLILCLLLRLIKHSLLLHPIISLKSLIRIPGILMRLSDQPPGRSNLSVTVNPTPLLHLSSSLYVSGPLEHTGFQPPSPFERYLSKQVYLWHHTLSNTPLPRILLPGHICTKTN